MFTVAAVGLWRKEARDLVSFAARYDFQQQFVAIECLGDGSRGLVVPCWYRVRQSNRCDGTIVFHTIWLRKTGRVREVGGPSRGWPNFQIAARWLCLSARDVFEQANSPYPDAGQRTRNRYTRLYPRQERSFLSTRSRQLGHTRLWRHFQDRGNGR